MVEDTDYPARDYGGLVREARDAASVGAAPCYRLVRLIGGIAAVVVAVAVVWVLFVPAADWLARLDIGSARGPLLRAARVAARGQLLMLGAGLFAAGALLRAARDARMLKRAEKRQVIHRYTTAIAQLGSDELDVRIGSIYALERVARDSARHHPTVVEVLTAFVREYSHKALRPPDPGGGEQERSVRPDVQAALTVVGRRKQKRDITPVDLTRADLHAADLHAADLTRARLTGARLSCARLTSADLHAADLHAADLHAADLTRARLTRADLHGADLHAADLAHADLAHADLAYADLTGADLTGARLTGARLLCARLLYARLTRADLSAADLTRADLIGADLTCAIATGADLTRADLTRADLTLARLLWADLTRAELADARWPAHAAVPEGWRLDTGTGRLAAGTGRYARRRAHERGHHGVLLVAAELPLRSAVAALTPDRGDEDTVSLRTYINNLFKHRR